MPCKERAHHVAWLDRVCELRVPVVFALAGVLVALGVVAGAARADEYGGLGPLTTFTPGANGGHLEVNPEGNRAFGVDPTNGSSYIADEIKVSGKRYFRIQKLSEKGEYLGEARVELASQAALLEGVAIDSSKERIYLLVVVRREGEHEEIDEKILEDEEKLELKKEALAKKQENHEPTEQIEQEITKLEAKIKKLEEEAHVFDPEAPVAAELYAFSTNVEGGQLKPAADTPATGSEAGLLAGTKTLGASSEEAGIPLLHPQGIAVDPVTHDVLILGQQDDSMEKGAEELRAAVQRVHTEGTAQGKLGPRYVDEENCLDEGAVIGAEPACAEGFGQPSSPFISSGGRLFAERSSELWEIPVTEGVSEAFESHPKIYEAKPRRLLTLGQEEKRGIVELVSQEEGQGGAAAFVSTGLEEGRIYLDAEITAEEAGGARSQSRGAAVFDLNESGGTPKARELGWTAGQNGTGENEKCILPLGGLQVLAGADDSGNLLLFDVTTAHGQEKATVNLLWFGVGGESCGHAKASPPSVSVNGQTVTTLKSGQKTSLSLDVFAADTNSVEWKFVDNGKEQADEPPVIESYLFPTQMPTLQHEFKHGGSYEVIAVVEPDDFGPKIEVHSNVTVEGEEGGGGSGAPIGAEFSSTSPATVGQPAGFIAKVTDSNNVSSPHAQYHYVWNFGDGTSEEGSGAREFRAEHAYASEGRYEVKLEVTDEGGRSVEETHMVQVNAPRAPASLSSPEAGGGDPAGRSSAAVVAATTAASAHIPDASLAGTSLAVTGSGALTLKVACPAGEISCAGTVTLRTLGVISTSARTRVKKGVLTLATGSFTVVGGRIEAVELHLSAKARALLAHSHSLRVRVTLLAHDPAGTTHTTQTVVTLRLDKHAGYVNKR